MDKLNYTLKNLKSQETKDMIDIINKNKRLLKKKLIKKQTIKRKRILKDYSILIEAVILYITESLSFQRLADLMAVKYKTKMSDVSWRKQILKIADNFVEAAAECLTEMLEKQSGQRSLKILGHEKCYALDATNFSHEGKKNHSVMRLHTQYALDSACSSFGLLTDGRTAESVTHFPIEENALYLADRAYGLISQLSYMIKHNADFIIRISPLTTKFFKDKDCREKVDFRDHISGEQFTLDCFIKYKKNLPGKSHRHQKAGGQTGSSGKKGQTQVPEKSA